MSEEQKTISTGFTINTFERLMKAKAEIISRRENVKITITNTRKKEVE